MHRWLMGLLALVLAAQFLTLSRLGDLQQRQSSWERHLRGEIDRLENEVNSLQAMLRDMQQANRWLTVARSDLQPAAGCNSATVTVDWSLSEVAPNAQVVLLYRLEGRDRWVEVPAEPTGALGYQARFDIDIEPSLESSVRVIRRTGTGHQEGPVEERVRAEPRSVQYRVVARGSSGERSSETRTLPAGHELVGRYYVMVTEQANNSWEVELEYKADSSNPCLSLTGATVRGLAGGQVVAEEPLSPLHGRMEAVIAAAGQELDGLEVVVRFGSGQEEVHQVPLG